MSKFRINVHVKTANLKGAQVLYDLIKETEELKAKVEALKGANDHEIEKALDDATSAFDIVVHHLLDIAGE